MKGYGMQTKLSHNPKDCIVIAVGETYGKEVSNEQNPNGFKNPNKIQPQSGLRYYPFRYRRFHLRLLLLNCFAVFKISYGVI